MTSVSSSLEWERKESQPDRAQEGAGRLSWPAPGRAAQHACTKFSRRKFCRCSPSPPLDFQGKLLTFHEVVVRPRSEFSAKEIKLKNPREGEALTRVTPSRNSVCRGARALSASHQVTEPLGATSALQMGTRRGTPGGVASLSISSRGCCLEAAAWGRGEENAGVGPISGTGGKDGHSLRPELLCPAPCWGFTATLTCRP